MKDQNSIQSYMLSLIFAACIAVLTGCANRPPPEPETSDGGCGMAPDYERMWWDDSNSSDVDGCYQTYEGLCYHALSLRNGCRGGCRYAYAPGAPINFAGTVTGKLMLPNNAGPLADHPVFLITPDNTKYLTRSCADGTFWITLTPEKEAGVRTQRFAKDFGEIVTLRELKGVAFFISLTDEFLAEHPDLEVVEILVEEFNGRTVEVE